MAVCAVDWPAPPRVKAFFTSRDGGFSSAPYGSFNLAKHVGDDSAIVDENRALLNHKLAGSSSKLDFQWLNQVHGTRVYEFEQACRDAPMADASITSAVAKVSVVLTADCLPLLFCDAAATQVAAVHAGWRGLAAGLISRTISYFNEPAESLLCFLGPAIGPSAFEVGADVLGAFKNAQALRKFAFDVGDAFEPSCPSSHHSESNTDTEKKYLANLYMLAKAELLGAGVSKVYGGNHCSYSESKQFFSYRRDRQTGRMATGIWLEP